MKGSCLCGGVEFEIDPPIKVFQYCHCSRCRKFSGGAFAANLFVPPEQFRWTKGAGLIGRFEHPEAKFYATCFCKNCGSSMPWEVQGGSNTVVPAGALDEDPEIRPQRNIFWGHKACWFEETDTVPKFSEYPAR